MIRPGETFIWGRDQKTAKALLAAAERVGLDEYAVHTTDGGFVVPDEVADEAYSDLHDGEPTPEPAAPTDPDQQF